MSQNSNLLFKIIVCQSDTKQIDRFYKDWKNIKEKTNFDKYILTFQLSVCTRTKQAMGKQPGQRRSKGPIYQMKKSKTNYQF